MATIFAVVSFQLRLRQLSFSISSFAMALIDEKVESAQAREFDVPSDKDGSDEEFNVTWTEQEEKRVRNKLDWQIVCVHGCAKSALAKFIVSQVPMVTVLYLMCFLDRYVPHRVM